jgi:hypothetical protein
MPGKNSDADKLATHRLGFRDAGPKPAVTSRAWSRTFLTLPTPVGMPPLGTPAGGRIRGSRDRVGGGLPPRLTNRALNRGAK